MKLDRNINPDGKGKYALIKMREAIIHDDYLRPCSISIHQRFIDYGGSDNDFFVIRLKDKYAGPALRAYEAAARADDPEYADEIGQLALNAETHPSKQKPD